jgi:hypothetical protein
LLNGAIALQISTAENAVGLTSSANRDGRGNLRPVRERRAGRPRRPLPPYATSYGQFGITEAERQVRPARKDRMADSEPP